jgi:hypothetical protein
LARWSSAGHLDVTSLLDERAQPRPVGEFDEFIRSHVPEPGAEVLAPGSYRLGVAGVVARRALGKTSLER